MIQHLVFFQNAETCEKDSGEERCCESEKKDISQEILFNPNVFTEFKLAGSPEVIYSSLVLVSTKFPFSDSFFCLILRRLPQMKKMLGKLAFTLKM